MIRSADHADRVEPDRSTPAADKAHEFVKQIDSEWCAICNGRQTDHVAIHRLVTDAPAEREPWLTMDRPDYPSHCNNCGYEGTNETMEKHECSEPQAVPPELKLLPCPFCGDPMELSCPEAGANSLVSHGTSKGLACVIKPTIQANPERWNTRAFLAPTEEPPLCPVHKSLDDRGKLELSIYSHNCLACALHQREEMLKMLVPFMLRETEDAISVLERIITVNDRNYAAVTSTASALADALRDVAANTVADGNCWCASNNEHADYCLKAATALARWGKGES